ncbi:MAG: hypothetical protein CL692_01470 [Cellvibrionales bacterium]|nr:hypothetical protein [Cellvibrionales bacterium]
MSEAQEEMGFQESSAEEKFFGVKTTIGRSSDNEEAVTDPNLELEIVDDRPEEDRRAPKASSSDGDIDDDELSGYSDRVQKRINKLRYEQNEERRQREAAERLREEAVSYAQAVTAKNKEYESLINRGEAALISQIKDKAQLSLESARQDYKKAYEEGDTDNVVAAQESLMRAQSELQEANKYEQSLANKPVTVADDAYQQQVYQQQLAREQAVAQQQPQQATVDPEAQDWASRNEWFMKPGFEEMTSLAYGAHAKAVQEGVAPNSSEYFQRIDSRMRSAFPDYNWQDSSDTYGRNAPVTVNQPSSVVAPSSRSNGAKPRKVRLTSSQIALAKRIGLTNEQYAMQLIKEGKQ